MKLGTFYGIGVGPGDPGLLTVKAAEVLGRSLHVFAPKARIKSDSVALEIARKYIQPSAVIYELVFPMVPDKDVLSDHWKKAAGKIVAVLKSGEDACFLTLGDSLLYSTYVYLLRELKLLLPETPVITVPGVTSFSAVAALTNFPLGEAKEPLRVIPAADDLTPLREALEVRGTIVLMKIGDRLAEILQLLEEKEVIDQSVFVARAGQKGERIETNLRKFKLENVEAGYLSVILIKVGK